MEPGQRFGIEASKRYLAMIIDPVVTGAGNMHSDMCCLRQKVVVSPKISRNNDGWSCVLIERFGCFDVTRVDRSIRVPSKKEGPMVSSQPRT